MVGGGELCCRDALIKLQVHEQGAGNQVAGFETGAQSAFDQFAQFDGEAAMRPRSSDPGLGLATQRDAAAARRGLSATQAPATRRDAPGVRARRSRDALRRDAARCDAARRRAVPLARLCHLDLCQPRRKVRSTCATFADLRRSATRTRANPDARCGSLVPLCQKCQRGRNPGK